MRRNYKSTQVPGLDKLYFYAAWDMSQGSTNLTPDYAWDGNYGFSATGGIGLGNNGLTVGDYDKEQIFLNCFVPELQSLTLNCWVTPTYYSSGWNKMFGWCYNTQSTQKTGFQIVKWGGYAYNTYTGFYCTGVNFSSVLVADGVKQFVSYTLSSLGSNQYNVKAYINGVLCESLTWTEVSDWTFTTNSNFIVGWNNNNANSSCQGYYSHFSCFDPLTDNQIYQLYKNGGIPSSY